MQLSWEWIFTGRAGAWFFTALALLVALICGLLTPWLITPRMTLDMTTVPAEVIRLDDENGMKHAVFEYTSPEGASLEYQSSIGSSRPAYAIGDQVLLAVNPDDPSSIFVQDDRDLAMMILIMRILGGIFFVLGFVIFVMLIAHLDSRVINRVGGLLGALSFGVPATLVLPGLWIAYLLRPNYLFRAQDAFDQQSLMIGMIFSVLGILVTIATIVLYRYQARTGSAGWTWSYSATSKTVALGDTEAPSDDVLDQN